MIANLIYTLMLALGVASGTYQSETCNAFNHVEEKQEKPIQKAQNVNNTYNLTWIINSTYDTGTAPNRSYSYKQYLAATIDNNGTDEDQSNMGTNVLLPPYLITNTAYTFSSSSDHRYSFNYVILKFTNYTNAVQTITFETSVTYNQTHTNSVWSEMYVYESTDTNLNNVIDLTLNASTYNTLNNVLDNAEKTQIKHQTNNYTFQNGTTNVSKQTPQITLNGGEKKYIIMKDSYVITNGTDSMGWITNNKTILNGTYIQNDITYEYINIPELMFTIITLPFAWYSTAFNLTIFPNTPYQLNFGNLILTIVAALILLYLIKKVLK